MEKPTVERLKTTNDKILFWSFIGVMVVSATLRNTPEFQKNNVLVGTAITSFLAAFVVYAKPEQR
jgi:hypothetical protein